MVDITGLGDRLVALCDAHDDDKLLPQLVAIFENAACAGHRRATYWGDATGYTIPSPQLLARLLQQGVRYRAVDSTTGAPGVEFSWGVEPKRVKKRGHA